MHSQLSGNFGERLTKLMTDQRVSARQLEALSRVDARLIRKYRAGRVEPRDPWGWPTPNALRIARALGVEVDHLMPPVEPKPVEPKPERSAA